MSERLGWGDVLIKKRVHSVDIVVQWGLLQTITTAWHEILRTEEVQMKKVLKKKRRPNSVEAFAVRQQCPCTTCVCIPADRRVSTSAMMDAGGAA